MWLHAQHETWQSQVDQTESCRATAVRLLEAQLCCNELACGSSDSKCTAPGAFQARRLDFARGEEPDRRPREVRTPAALAVLRLLLGVVVVGSCILL